MLRPSIFFVGASGVGKTSLAQSVVERYGLPMVVSETSRVMSEFKDRDVRSDASAMSAMQMAIFATHHKAISEAYATRQPFVPGRGGLECLAYWAAESYDTAEGANSQALTDLSMILRGVKEQRDYKTVVFFVRPHERILERARASDGGRRDEYLRPEKVYRVDGATSLLLEKLRVPYVSISCQEFRDRVRTVERVVELASLR